MNHPAVDLRVSEPAKHSNDRKNQHSCGDERRGIRRQRDYVVVLRGLINDKGEIRRVPSTASSGGHMDCVARTFFDTPVIARAICEVDHRIRLLSKLVAADDALTDTYERSFGIGGSNHCLLLAIEAVSKAIDRDRTIVAVSYPESHESPHGFHRGIEHNHDADKGFQKSLRLAQNVLNTLTAALPLL